MPQNSSAGLFPKKLNEKMKCLIYAISLLETIYKEQNMLDLPKLLNYDVHWGTRFILSHIHICKPTQHLPHSPASLRYYTHRAIHWEYGIFYRSNTNFDLVSPPVRDEISWHWHFKYFFWYFDSGPKLSFLAGNLVLELLTNWGAISSGK
jgi:hypothetical protein